MTPLDMVTEFHTAFGHPILTIPQLPADRIEFRVGFIAEKVAEFEVAVRERDVVGALDALGDIAYVTIGAALEFGTTFETPNLFPASPLITSWSGLEAEALVLQRRLGAIATAVHNNNIVGVNFSLSSLYFEVVDIAEAYGFPLDEALAEIHRSNMAKRGGEIRADGKQMKPAGWTAPDLEKIMLQHARLPVAA